MSIFMLSLQSSLHTISSLVHTVKIKVTLWKKWLLTRGEKQWKIIKPSPKTAAVVAYQRSGHL